jgi:hypothetical protein
MDWMLLSIPFWDSSVRTIIVMVVNKQLRLLHALPYLAVISMAAHTNSLANALQIPVAPEFLIS